MKTANQKDKKKIWIQSLGKKKIKVWTSLENVILIIILEKYDSIEINTKVSAKIKLLKDKIVEIFNLSEIEKSDYTYISNARQIALLKKCLGIINDIRSELEMDVPVDLMQINIQLLWETLGEITGQVYKDDLLDEIFSKFCLGKQMIEVKYDVVVVGGS